MFRVMRTLIKCTLVVLIFTYTAFKAHATQSHFAQWNSVFLNGKLSENWGWSLETQTRVAQSNTVTNGNRLLLRPAIRWLPWGNGDLQIHFGYGWTPNFQSYRTESRFWQQVLRQNDAAQWWWATRFRFEERLIQNTTQTSYRTRAFARIHRYLSDDQKLGFSLWDELFWNINTINNGPKSGFDQNRIFLGPHFKLSPQARLETGYINVLTGKGRGNENLITHAYLLYVYLDF